jgi:hypothetical protein
VEEPFIAHCDLKEEYERMGKKEKELVNPTLAIIANSG